MVMPREERPPYVQFEIRSVEDRAASIAAGHWVGKDIPHVIITPQGSKDRIERVAKDWFAEKAQHASEGRFPRKWLEEYREAFNRWTKDEEPILHGAPLRSWPPIGPSQYKILRDLRILTVEDLASANEETIHRIGPGARALKATAEEWLAQASGIGRDVARSQQLESDNATLQQTVVALQSQLDNVTGQLRAERNPDEGVVVSNGVYQRPQDEELEDALNRS